MPIHVAKLNKHALHSGQPRYSPTDPPCVSGHLHGGGVNLQYIQPPVPHLAPRAEKITCGTFGVRYVKSVGHEKARLVGGLVGAMQYGQTNGDRNIPHIAE